MTNHTIKAKGIIVNTAPIGFHVYARKFLEAAPTATTTYSPVPYYCLCRALELVLKSFLSARGVAISKLRSRSLGHNLAALLDAALQHGIADFYHISVAEKAELLKANVYYADKGFEYFQLRFAMRGEPSLPSLDILRSMVQSFINSIHKLALDAS